MAWIEKTRTGLRMVDRINVDGKIKRISVPLDKDTPQARRRATDALREKAAIIEQPITAMTLETAWNDYLKLKKCKESTKIYIRRFWPDICTVIPKDTPICNLKPAMIRKALYTYDRQPDVVNRMIKVLKTFTKWMLAMEYIETDPCKNLEQIKIDRAEKDPAEMYLEPDQLKELLSNLDGMAYYTTAFLALTGLRIGELTALTVDDITDNYIRINKAYSQHSGETTPPKTSSSIRNVFIQPELRDLINEFMKWRNLDMMAYGIRPATLFYTRNGTCYHEIIARNHLKKYGVHPHMLRHTHVALLAEQGMSFEAIARRLGHAGTGVTKAVYYHVTEKQKQKDEAFMSQIKIL